MRSLRLLLAAAIAVGIAQAAEIHVMISGGLTSTYNELVPQFERETGHKVVTASGASMGPSPNAIPNRIARGEPVDVVFMVGDALGDLEKAGKVVPSSRVDIANSKIALAVRSGDAKPDISTLDGLKRAFLDAKSIAYSESASGVYIERTLLPRLGIWEQVKDKSRMVRDEPVGQAVARGEAQLGFQQLSELKPVKGIEIVGMLPAEAQKVTVFSAGISTSARQPDAGRQLIEFLSSAKAGEVLARAGMEPIPRR
jgi:molybdate transport system substrate-binding protein